LNGIYFDEIKGKNPDIKIYKVTDKDDQVKTVTIDEKKVEIKIEK
jgi:hypothetical protein